jgi:hypothetical protein
VSVVAAVDLDRTLIYSGRALALPGPDSAAPALLVGEVYRGEPISFLTAEAGRLLVELAYASTLVPTTTRTREQYSRVRLPGPAPRYAITANGGHLLIDGVTDPDWRDRVDATLAATSAPLVEVAEHFRKVCERSFVRKRRVAEELFCYAVVEREELPSGFVSELASWAEPQGWKVSLQGRKLYVVPKELTKSAAVAEVARQVGATRVLAAGDSLLDAELLAFADQGVRPAHGELHDTGWTSPKVHVTGSYGVVAGEDIARWLVAEALHWVG